MPAPPLIDAGAPQLSDEHLRQITAARLASRKIRRAIGVAKGDGWTLAIFAAFSLLFSIGNWSGMLMGVCLGAIAWVELYGAGRLRRLEPQATRILGFNQVALSSLLVLYACCQIYAELTGHGQYAALVGTDPQLSDALQPFQQLTNLISMTFYCALIVIAVFAQGGLALYYFTRAKLLRAYIEQTPQWIVAMQKADISI
jgi:hypothetical protein